MAPNSRRRKIKSDAVCRSLLSTKNVTPSKKNLGAVFTEMPHMYQEKPQISEFLQGDSKKSHLQSILERNALDEFLEMSLSSHAKFTESNYVNVLLRQLKQDISKNTTFVQETLKDYPIVPIPRRPLNYVTGHSEKIVSPNELDALENASFLKWRLELADMQEKEKLCMTPFERNIQFWRQLWRVLEKSQVVFQILDVRNPNFYRSKDLESYVSEIHPSKRTILLLNKSDLVPKTIRALWAQFFYQQKVPCLFFSAILSTDECNMSDPLQSEIIQDSDNFTDNIMSFLWNLSKNGELVSTSKLIDIMQHLRDHLQKESHFQEIKSSQQSDPVPFQHRKHLDKSEHSLHEQITCIKNEEQMKQTDEINKENLKEFAENYSSVSASKTDEKYFTFRLDLSFTVGFVGYPNVGKSSIMNALLGDKKVSVSRQPGKTKHFQTFQLSTLGLNLCDCPGLVFPQIVTSQSYLVINSVSSIDNLRGSFTAPIQLICNQIGQQLFDYYNVKKDTYKSKNTFLEAREFLTALAFSRHQTSGGKGGLPRLFDMAKLVLRDYCSGNLRHWRIPPNCDLCEDGLKKLKPSPDLPDFQIDNTFIEDNELLKSLTQTNEKHTTPSDTVRKARFIEKRLRQGKKSVFVSC
ncbi:uncharacterized protein LOC128884295 [Hylaeus volcanicus]|uniref:uncharacterized protein LOC128884295 n=1 Tax=Hylaeus volcanicus TaxID=313075 RepID=UPI0023B81E4D|nr:uncharacterized protein LOC128884295 [Hylaeus volcanicus]